MQTLEDIRRWCNGVWIAGPQDGNITELAIDTRKVDDAAATLFVALKSPRRNGHDFIPSAYALGIRAFLVSEDVNAALAPNAAIIRVPDTLAALQAVGAQHRAQFSIPVIGITGSNGKTVVKEWLHQLLSESFDIVRSPKSYNSQIGVPLSAWLMEPHHQLAILEAGISEPGEMDKLERIVRPTIGILTNIGSAHNEGFLSQRQKVHEKLLLFKQASHLIYCCDQREVEEVIGKEFLEGRKDKPGSGPRLFSWGQSASADLSIQATDRVDNTTHISASHQGTSYKVIIPFKDGASIENAIHCWAVALLLHLEPDVINERMQYLQPVAMRLEQQRGINDCTIINDSYNSDLTSLQIALEVLDQQTQHARHTLILSDIQQAGLPSDVLYEEVAGMVKRRNIHRFIGIGSALLRFRENFEKIPGLESAFFSSTNEFIQAFRNIAFYDEAILLKGARTFSFEKINLLLGEELHQTVLSIDLSALQHNLGVFRRQAGKSVKMMAMVKAFSYGSGSHEIAQALQFAGVEYLSVAYADEGIVLRKAGITMPIMVMSPDIAAFDRMIAWKLEPEIFNLRSLEAFTSLASTLDVRDYPIHIKLDTGMHRLGFTATEVPPLAKALQGNYHVKVASVFSHLAASEDAGLDGFTLQQAAAFEGMTSQLIAALGYQPLRHLCNSAGIARHPELHFDMVRLGLGLYGIDGSGKLQHELRQISRLRTTISQIKDIPPGDTVGYGRRGIADQPLRTATISIGYADGYPRALGNGKAHVLIHGKPARLVGIVCMDMCMVDVTHIPEATEGDEVIVFGPELPLAQLSLWADTIPYEMMTGISQRVKRVYVNEG